ncbi:hypothetical protein ACPV5R_20365, partial [Vibrio astriarenae]
YETQFILTAPNWLNFNSDNNPARGGYVSVGKDRVNIKSNIEQLTSLNLMVDKVGHDRDYGETLFPASDWHDDFAGHDIVTSALPIVSRDLFDSLSSLNDIKKTEKYANIANYSNGLGAFFEQDALLVHPDFGLFINDNNDFHNERKSNVYSFAKKRSTFYLNEVNNYNPNDNKRRMVSVFISPQSIDREDLLKLNSIMKTDPEYAKGVKEGWSVLITGMKQNNVVIASGLKHRSELIEMIPDQFWELYKEFDFEFCDGNPVIPVKGKLH